METQEKIDNQTTAPVETSAPEAAAASETADKPTDTQNQSQLGTRAEHVREALAILYEHFPKAFVRENTGDARPLKIGILDDLKKEVPNLPGMTMSKLRSAVRLYCTRLRYLFNVREGAQRIDLHGNEVEAVTAEHAKYAKERFEQINEERKKKQEQRAEVAKDKDNKEEAEAGKRPFNKNGKRPFNKNAAPRPNSANPKFNKFKKPSFVRPQRDESKPGGHPVRKPMVHVSASSVRRGLSARSFGVPSTEADLKAGTSVLVLNNNHYMKGSVVAAPKDGMVRVQLSTGLIMALPIERVLLPGKPAALKKDSSLQ